MSTTPIRVLLAAALSVTFAANRASAGPTRGPEESELRALVEADWHAQEQRRGRQPQSLAAIHASLTAAESLLSDLSQGAAAPSMTVLTGKLRDLRRQAENARSLGEAARLALYHQIRWSARRLALSNPLLAGRPIVFMKRRRFISQMLHEYLGYYYDYGDIAGGGVFVLEHPGWSLRTKDLIAGRLPRGNYTTLALSLDARTVYFAFAQRASEKPDYYSSQRRCFHLFVMDADGGNLRQLTEGPNDDFDPCPLPDGGLAFLSTRRGGFGRCHNEWEPLPAYTLHRMPAFGGKVQTLSFHETNEWHPSVLHDGRIIYTRWDYVDRSASNYHGLWVTNPDGTAPAILFGNYTKQINACYQPKAIPGSRKVVFVAGAHHAVVGGALVLLDPERVALDRQTGHDRLDAIDVLTPEVCFPEAPGWPGSYYHSPWPLAENYYLVSFSFQPLPGMGPKVKEDHATGLYYFDRFGNFELLYRDRNISCMYPIPLTPRPLPPIVAGERNPQLGNEAELVLSDVHQSLRPLPERRPIHELRIYQVLPKTTTHVANRPWIGYAFAESARMLLGSVPVEPDGSAYFRVPAQKPIYFQAVDAQGRAVQTMRSVTYLQPGERRGCVGCHEPTGQPAPTHASLALGRPPSPIQPGPDGTRPFSFVRLIQPLLDRRCVACHDGTAGPDKSTLLLTGAPASPFTRSYQSLRPFVRWHEWRKETIHPVVTVPGRQGSDESPLTRVIDDALHTRSAKLTDRERRRLYLWLDSNAPFYGAYTPDEQQAQLAGKAVPPPRAQ